jgi:hypothetical protein
MSPPHVVLDRSFLAARRVGHTGSCDNIVIRQGTVSTVPETESKESGFSR